MIDYHVSKREAQALAVIAQRLDRRPFTRKVRKADILELIEHLGSVQLDAISVISRSHETVLWSRLGPYDPDLVTALFAPDNALTEYLVHAAAILPTSLLPLFRSHMEAVRAREAEWLHEPENALVREAVLERIRKDGPISSRHFEPPPGAERKGAWDWWGTKPEREMLATLWYTGELMIHMRDRGFARHFDLAERVAPGFWDGDAIGVEERDRILARHAVRALGVTTARWADDYWRTGNRRHISAAKMKLLLPELAANGDIVSVTVEGIDLPIWMDPALVPRLDMLRNRTGWPTRTTFLSPFDSLTWNNDRGRMLWDFDYRLELYVPREKRQFGYYAMPILHRGRLIGRMDPSFDRKAKVLTVKALALESGVKPTSAISRAISAAFDELVLFLGGPTATWRLANGISFPQSP